MEGDFVSAGNHFLWRVLGGWLILYVMHPKERIIPKNEQIGSLSRCFKGQNYGNFLD